MTSNINPHILRYIEMIERHEVIACEDQILLAAHVRKCFAEEDIYTDGELLEKYLSLLKYFPYERLYEWEAFVFALNNCTFRRSDDRPRWPDVFILGGRGLGKDGYIAFDSFALTSPHNPALDYDIDICANNEDQALRPVRDVVKALNTSADTKKLKTHYKWLTEMVTGKKNGGTIRGRTNNPSGKDGMRSGKIVFNEIHQYKNYDNINVFKTGLGKRRHPRTVYATTNGTVRDGPLDDLLSTSEDILSGAASDDGMLPFVCRLDDKEEVHDPANWPKANPSLLYCPDLYEELRKEYKEWLKGNLPDFMTKRMSLPDQSEELRVTDYENIKATNKPLPDICGWECVLGIDFTKINDMASVNAHFRKGDARIDINHSWICTQSKDIPRIKAPLREWEAMKLLTFVDEVEIHPIIIIKWIKRFIAEHRVKIKKIAIDDFRYALFAKYLDEIHFDAKTEKNLVLVKPAHIMKAVPVIDSIFANQNFVWGNNPVLRWAANNTKKVRSGRAEGTDTGNYYYAKIEGKSRKTDPFMALVASMVIEDEIAQRHTGGNLPLIRF